MNLPAEAVARPCPNCEAPLHGRYCASCGQAAHGSARSLETLFHDAWHDLTHLDGRLWGTLRALAVHPGLLTAEYLRDRRARWLPPFRLYLVLSVVFFGLAAAAEGASGRAVRIPADPAAAAVARARLEEAARELDASGQGAVAGVLRSAAAPDAARTPQAERLCALLAPAGGRLGPPLASACGRAVADGGRALGHAFLANVPKTMLVFLPLVALMLFGLFGRSRRYYVEHLVLVLHLQSALFLFASAALALDVAARWGGGAAEAASGLASVGLWGYGTWYAYRTLRVAYGEGRAATLAKLAALGLSYAVLLGATLVGTAVVSALTA